MLLFVAAEKREFAGLLRRVKQPRPLPWAVEFAVAALIRDEPVVLVANGAGPRRAAEALAAIPREPIRGVISTGLCGALDPDLRVGRILCASEIRWAGGAIAVRTPAQTPPCERGALWSQDRVASTAVEKRNLWRESGCRAVEMEGAGLAPTMRQWGVPLYSIRAISDEGNEDFVLDLNAARLPDGRFSSARVVGKAIAALASSRPWAGISELWRLSRQSSIAAESLGEFLVNCRF